MREALPRLLVRGQSGIAGDLRIRHRVATSEEPSAQLDQSMALLCRASLAGGFWSGRHFEERAQISIVAPTEHQDGGWVLLVQVSSLDSRIWQCWRNMVARLDRFGVSVSDIDVLSLPDTPPEELDPIDDHTESLAYPAASSEIQELLRFAPGDAAKSRRCLIEVDRPLARHDVAQFENWIQPWYEMLEAGAFAPPIGTPSEEECLRGAVSQFDPTTLEVSVVRFRASEQAWLLLGNMVTAWWRQHGRVLRILID